MPKHNNFDCIRLFASLLVLVSHSFALAGVSDPYPLWLGNYDSGGGTGVAIFFVISGYLVSGSVSRRSTTSYVTSRALRILPALALVSCFDVFVVGPLFTTHSLSSFFSNPSTWDHLRNPMIFRMNLFLPGVFETLIDHGVNGSLWTLPAECGLYLILPALAVCGGLTKRGSIIAFTTCAAAYLVASQYFGISIANQGPEIISHVTAHNAFKHTTFFLAGATLWANRQSIAFHAGGAFLCVAILFACAGTVTAPLAYILCVPYLVIFLAFKTRALPLEKIGDLSYGTYLFAFPIQQALVSTLGVGHPIWVTAIAIPIVLALAFVSWWFVEKPALRLRDRRTAAVIPIQSAAA